MTPDREIERILDRWFADGPTEVPDRVLDAAVSRIYAQPQRRVWRLPLKEVHMTIPARLAAVAAAVILVAAGVAWFGRSPASQIGAPTSSPSASPSVSPATSPALCQTSDPTCLGPLAAGRHTSDLLVPRMSYFVGDGWSKGLDVPMSFNIERADSPGSSILVTPDPVIADPSGNPQPAPGVGRKVADLVGWLRSNPKLTTTSPNSVTLGGYAGQMLDVSVKDAASDVPFFVHDPSDGGHWIIRSVEKLRIWLLDTKDGHVVMVGINAVNTQFDSFLVVARPVVDSLDFRAVAPGPSGSPGASAVACLAGPCLGVLSPGSYRTKDVLVPFSYRVPAGWQNTADIPGNYMLEQQQPAAQNDAIYIWPDPVVASQGTCVSAPEPGVGRTVGALVGWLTTQPGLVTTTKTVNLGGLTGQMLEIRTKPGWTGACGYKVSLFVHQGTIEDGLWWDIGENARMHLWLLDAGNGHVLAIDAEAHDPTTADAFFAASTPVVESFDFTP